MKKATANYWVDVSIGISFILSVVSGLVFLLPVAPGARILGISYSLWSDLHTWSSVGMILGVAAHLVLHWRWILGMTKKMVLPERTSPQALANGTASSVTRRQFLSFGLATLLAGAAAVGCSALFRERAGTGRNDDSVGQLLGEPEQLPQQQKAELSQSGESELPLQEDSDASPEDVRLLAQPGDVSLPQETEVPAQQQGGVACPRGVVNDPFPGRCRHYTDGDGDRFCDYSIPGSGVN